MSVGAILLATALIGGLEGPGRFCGYAPIIDLVAGEKVETLEGGIHGGTFRWDGPFGSLKVWGIGWASKPKGRIAGRTDKGHRRFNERRAKNGFTVAIWNGETGAAYFSSPKPLTKLQLAAIDRVDLYNEGEEPKGCDLRTVFVWE
ncbi:MAG: hypothetical protein EOP60_17330 [Sphingomonadales bacterium]|nr:MAG: hypothetical protein EOP60_17330 [Sphingomonadales bacterium]